MSVSGSLFASSRLRTVLAMALLGCIVHPLALAADDFRPHGWAKLADAMSQRMECLKIAGRSAPQGMKCLLAQASQLPPIDGKHRDWFGEFYDPTKYRECLEKVGGPIGTAGCEPYRLMRQPEPEYWPYLDAPRVRWPEPPHPPTYQEGMKSGQYFEALCEKEAGEFIYRVVEGVEGLYQVRPRKRAWDYALEDRYVIEDPYGYTREEAVEPWFVFAGKGKYSFHELPAIAATTPDTEPRHWDPTLFSSPQQTSVVARHLGYDGRDLKSMKRHYDSELRARYGFTWRGISRHRDRELGIAGGELAVVDLRSGEILGLRRGFLLSGNARRSRSGINWDFAPACPSNAAGPGLNRGPGFAFAFISKVLRPARERLK
jgi:hypothetical protein